jgi:hypothetical protein
MLQRNHKQMCPHGRVVVEERMDWQHVQQMEEPKNEVDGMNSI